MIDTQFLDGLGRFNLIIRKKVTSSYAGSRRSTAQGKGKVFKDHRIYAPGDDYRSIDWRVYARTDDLMIKNYEEDKNLTLHVLVDSSSSMKFANKFDYASMLGVGHAYLAMKNNDKFQFATFSEDFEVFQARRGFSQVMSMIEYLNRIKLQGKTDLLKVTQEYKKIIGSRALIVIVSDFLVPIDNIRNALFYLKGNEVTVIQVVSPSETSLDMEGDFKLVDSESSEIMRTYMSPKAREDYDAKFQSHTNAIKHECDINNFKYFQIITDTPIFEAFYRILR